MDVKDIMEVLHTDDSFWMVIDRIVSFEGDNKCVGAKSVSINEPFFQGHFFGHPVMPGSAAGRGHGASREYFTPKTI